MCGILGFISHENYSKKINFKASLDAMSHRGPDFADEFLLKEQNFNLHFGHLRLSIIDLSGGANQPFHYKNFVLTYNGEIYNFQEIKKELLSKGHQFQTTSDTEVLIHSFEEWGTNCVNKFIGMFAFAIYDKEEGKIILCRDRVGVKPLYYRFAEGTLAFSSELKGIVKMGISEKTINREAVMDFFSFGYISEPLSIFQDIYKLPSGHYLEWKLGNNTITMASYWNPSDYYKSEKFKGSYEEAKEELHPLLVSACHYRMVSDVPVGVFLSGGFDSSLVTAILAQDSQNQLSTFSIGFEDKKYNEAPYAAEVAKLLNTHHQSYIFTQKDVLDLIPKICHIYDEPFSDVSMFPTTFLSHFVRKDVTVALSADGGDEIFAGYDIYARALKSYNKFSILKDNKFASKALQNIPSVLPEKYDRLKYNIKALGKNLIDYNTIAYLEQMSRRTDSGILHQLILGEFSYKSPFQKRLEEGAANFGLLNGMLYTDTKGYMSNNILIKTDRASMSASLEAREPLLDHRVLEFAAKLPENFKYDGKIQKKILKDITYQYLPKDLMDRPKAGFTLPLFEWLLGDLKSYSEYYLSGSVSAKYGIINPEFTEKVRKYFFDGKNVYRDLAWQIIIFNQWCENWLD